MLLHIFIKRVKLLPVHHRRLGNDFNIEEQLEFFTELEPASAATLSRKKGYSVVFCQNKKLLSWAQ